MFLEFSTVNLVFSPSFIWYFLEGHHCLLLTLNDWGVMLLCFVAFRIKYLYTLSGIILHRFFIISYLLLCLFSHIIVLTCGYLFYTLNYNPMQSFSFFFLKLFCFWPWAIFSWLCVTLTYFYQYCLVFFLTSSLSNTARYMMIQVYLVYFLSDS